MKVLGKNLPHVFVYERLIQNVPTIITYLYDHVPKPQKLSVCSPINVLWVHGHSPAFMRRHITLNLRENYIKT